MKLVHFFPPHDDLSFLKNTKLFFEEKFGDIFTVLEDKEPFIEYLRNLKDETNVVLVTTHGHDGYFLLNLPDRMDMVSYRDADIFQNDFVFAACCETAKKLGLEAINKKALTYVGFKGRIYFTFHFDDPMHQKYTNVVTAIVTKIYCQCINESFYRFINECLTAKDFVAILEWSFNTSIGQIIDQPIEEINQAFSLNLSEHDAGALKEILLLEILSKFNSLSSQITLLGDENYISWFNISSLSAENVERVLSEIQHMERSNDHYKYFVEIVAYTALNDRKRTQESIEKLNDHLSENGTTFYPSILKKIG